MRNTYREQTCPLSTNINCAGKSKKTTVWASMLRMLVTPSPRMSSISPSPAVSEVPCRLTLPFKKWIIDVSGELYIDP